MLTELWPALVIMLVFMFLNFPIYISVLAAALYICIFVVNMPLQLAFTIGFEGISRNALMAIPFFVLAGNCISEGTMGKRLIECFTTIFKGVRAGLPVAATLASGVFGAISGSPPAQVAVFTKILHKPLADSEGDKMATGLIISSAGTDGLFPPSVTLIIYGLISEQSVAKLFIAGIMPAMLLTVMYIVYCLWKCKNKTMEKIDWKEVAKAWKKGIPILLMPLLVLGGIYGGFVTPTEAGALAAGYCVIMGLAMKDLKPSDLIKVLRSSMRTIAQVFILIVVSTFFARMLIVSQFHLAITAGLAGLSPWQFLLMLNILLLMVGMFFDPIAGMLIMVPVLLPAAISMGVDPVHLGIIVATNLLIGMFTPPFGINIFVSQSILKYDIKYYTICLAPFIGIYLVALVLLTYVPAITLWLPNLMFG